MLRRTALACAAALVLVPGNLLAGALASSSVTCEERGCGCPTPLDEALPSWTEPCCCAAQPMPAPADRPADPLQAPEASAHVATSPHAADAGLPGADVPSVRIHGRPVCHAQAPPDPLYLRFHNLRL